MPDVSVVIPVLDRRGSLESIFHEFSAELEALGRSAEFVFAARRTDEDTIAVVKRLSAANPGKVVLVLLGERLGEATLLNAAFEVAQARVVVTLPAYMQVGPEGLAAAFSLVAEGTDVVVGSRDPRLDSVFNRLQNRLFHWLVGLLTSSRFKDISCGFRVMRRSVVDKLRIYGGLYRFIPILAESQGFLVRELSLAQRREDLETRYHGSIVYLKRMLDILSIFFLVRFTRSPLRFFGLLGSAVAGAGFVITAWLGIYRLLGFGGIADRPLLLLGVLLIVLGIQTLSLGLIGEIIIFTHAREVREYRVAEVIHYPNETS